MNLSPDQSLANVIIELYKLEAARCALYKKEPPTLEQWVNDRRFADFPASAKALAKSVNIHENA
jgi:hypothetical protein